MAFDAHSNFGYSTVAVAPVPANSGTSLSVVAGQGALFPAAPFNCTVWPAGVMPLASNAEIVRVTAVVGDALTIVRAQESSTAINIEVGFQIANSTSVKVFTDIEAAVTAAEGDIVALQAGKQDLDAVLTDLSGLALVQGDVLYYNGTNLVRLAAGAAGQVLQTQGAGANPQWAAAGTGDLLAANNLSDVANASTSRTNLGLAIGTNVQAQDAVLQDLADAALVQGDILYYNGTNLVRLAAGTNGNFLQTQGAGANPIWAATSGGSDWTTTVIKSADQTVTNNATLQNDTELFIALDTESYYLVEAIICISGNNTTGDYQFLFTHPNIQGSSPQSAALGYYAVHNTAMSPSFLTVAGGATSWPTTFQAVGIDGADSYFPLICHFAIRTTGVSGNLQYQFANNAAGIGRTSITRAGSMLRVKKIWP